MLVERGERKSSLHSQSLCRVNNDNFMRTVCGNVLSVVAVNVRARPRVPHNAGLLFI